MSDENSAARLRLFVAIPVPNVVREEMARVQRELFPLAPRHAIRWSKPEQFHLTLRFLGDVSSDCVPALHEAVRAVCGDMPALHLRAQGIDFFPNVRSPRVVWIGVNDGKNLLAALQEKIEGAVRPFTIERGGERFAGHLTLGRFKQFKPWEIKQLAAGAGTMKDRLFGKWTAQEVEIIRSELLPAGAHYTPLAVFALGAKIDPA